MKNSIREHRTDSDFGPLFSGELLKDEAISKVSEHNESWINDCMEKVKGYVSYRNEGFTGEDIRFYLVREVGYPAHSNAWGALVSTLIKRKIIKPTGEYRAMRDDSSHARKTPVYTK
jgi:hypothetical protein